jgi:hypothetical protein
MSLLNRGFSCGGEDVHNNKYSIVFENGENGFFGCTRHKRNSGALCLLRESGGDDDSQGQLFVIRQRLHRSYIFLRLSSGPTTVNGIHVAPPVIENGSVTTPPIISLIHTTTTTTATTTTTKEKGKGGGFCSPELLFSINLFVSSVRELFGVEPAVRFIFAVDGDEYDDFEIVSDETNDHLSREMGGEEGREGREEEGREGKGEGGEGKGKGEGEGGGGGVGEGEGEGGGGEEEEEE